MVLMALSFSMKKESTEALESNVTELQDSCNELEDKIKMFTSQESEF